jgi:antitoxin CptB
MTEIDKVKWQCRRGSRELDLLLNNYLQTRYLTANEDERARFIAMLKLDDMEMWNQFSLLYGQDIAQIKQ